MTQAPAKRSLTPKQPEFIISPDFGDDPDGYISVNALPGVGLAVAIGLFMGALVFAIVRYTA